MDVVQIGPFAILLKWVFLGLAFLIGLMFIKNWLRRSLTEDSSEKMFDLLSNGLFLLIIVWKLSLIILEPNLVLKSPFSLLFFTGGDKGLFLAITATTFYIFFKGRTITSQIVIVRLLLIFGLTVASSYHFLFLFYLEENELFHLLFALVASIILIFILKWEQKSVS